MYADATSAKKKRAAEGVRYYEGRHDILNHRLFYFNNDGVLTEDTTRANIKISHPFFQLLSDQLVSFFLSFSDNPIRAVESADGLQGHLDEYFDDEFWDEIGELIGGAYNKGFEYFYAFKNAANRLQFECADSMGVVEIPAKHSSDGKPYVIYHFLERIERDGTAIKRIQVWTENETYYYKQEGDGAIILDDMATLNPRPHIVQKGKDGKLYGNTLGFVPFFRLDYNRKQVSGLAPIKALIDDYDLHACALSNNLVDFDTPLHVVSGFKGSNLDELQKNLKTKKVIGVGEGGNVEVRTVDIPHEARVKKLELDKQNIFIFGGGLNVDGLKDTSATTNMAIKMAYALLELKTNKLQTRLKHLLMHDIIRIVLDEINKTYEKAYQLKDIYFDFTRSLLTNETENAQIAKTEAETKQIAINMLLGLAATLDDETIVKLICEELDINYDEIKNKLPDKSDPAQAVTNARDALGDIVTDGEGD
jgi:SPP1 family phage portal protein